MGINKAWSTFSVTVFCREITRFMCFLLNSLWPKTMEMRVEKEVLQVVMKFALNDKANKFQ